MKLFGIALAAMAVATLGGAAQAAPKEDKTKAQGMAEAPAVIQAAGLACTLADARFIAKNTDKATKVDSSYYEVNCSEGGGYVLVGKSDGSKPGAFTCLETGQPRPDGKPSGLECKLPGNADALAGMRPFVTKAGVPCEIEKARSIGAGAKAAYFEIACKGGAGYIMSTSSPPNPAQDVAMQSCLLYEPGGNVSCTLTDRAAQLAIIDQLAAQSDKNCAIKDKRYVLSTKDGSNYFEASCQDGKGYMFQQGADGKLARAIDCAQAEFVGGGCTLTDARAAQTEQAGLYTRLAKKGGFDCDVAKYGMLPAQVSGVEVVELQCSNRPDGAIAEFGANTAKFHNCVLAEFAGYRCSFTKKEPYYPGLTQHLVKFGKGSCQVSDVRGIGTTDTDGYLEVACSDGLPGWVLVFPKGTDQPKELLSCVQAKGVGGGCKLPTNVTKK